MDKIYQQTRQKELARIKAQTIEQMVALEIDARVLERTDPEAIVAHKVLTRNSAGEPMSARNITAKDRAHDIAVELEGLQKRIEAINDLLK